jgi:hypothetical protein
MTAELNYVYIIYTGIYIRVRNIFPAGGAPQRVTSGEGGGTEAEAGGGGGGGGASGNQHFLPRVCQVEE